MSELQFCHPPAVPSSTSRRTARKRQDGPVIDIHCHALSQEAEKLATTFGLDSVGSTLRFASEASQQSARQQRLAITAKLTTLESRLTVMDAAGIDVQVVSPAPNQYYYDAPPDAGQALARQVNESICALVARAPERLVGLATVPLQSPGLAVKELHHAVKELGMRGVEIGTNVAGTDLDSDALAPFFRAAEDLGVLVFMHPAGFTQGDRLRDYYLNNVIGNPLDSTIALSRLIFGGVLERHKSLKLCVAHGGGYLPSYFGRTKHAWQARSECQACLHEAPGDSLRRVHFDTLVHDGPLLQYLIETHGAERLLMGSDYPYDMGDEDPISAIERLRISDADKDLLLGGNAARLLDLAHLKTKDQ